VHNHNVGPEHHSLHLSLASPCSFSAVVVALEGRAGYWHKGDQSHVIGHNANLALELAQCQVGMLALSALWLCLMFWRFAQPA